MGEADTYVAAAIGAVFGIYNLPIVLLLGLFAYALFFVPAFLYDKFRAKDYPTFITFILFVINLILCLTILQNYFGISLLLISALLFIHFMFKKIDKNHLKYIPYVPAFSIGVLLFLIFFTTQGLIYDNSILSDSIQKLLSF